RRAGEKQREARERSDVRPAREAVGRERDRLDLHRHGPHADQGLEDGTIEFKTRSNDGETFTAAHIHQGAVGIEAPPWSCFSEGRTRARARSSRAAPSGNAKGRAEARAFDPPPRPRDRPAFAGPAPRRVGSGGANSA